MLAIIHNVWPKHPLGDDHTHWLITLIERVKTQCNSDSTLRLNRKVRDGYVIYTLRDLSSKRKVTLYVEAGRIYVEVYTLLPLNTADIYHPQYGNMEAHGTFNLYGSGISLAADFVAKELEETSAYSVPYAKIQFSLDEAKVDGHTVFLGGRILKHEYSEEYDTTQLVLIGPNKRSKALSLNHRLNGRINPDRLNEKFVIIKGDSAHCFHQTAYSNFYQEV